MVVDRGQVRRCWETKGPSRRRVPLGLAATFAALVVATGLVLPGLGGVPHAAAHAALVGSVPERGARLDEPPRQVELTFNEPVEAEFSEVVLTREDGGTVELGPLKADGATLRLEVRGPMPAGEYVLHYRVLSEDGHPIEGDVPFTVTAPSPGAGGADQQPAPPSAGDDEPGGATTPSSPAEEPAPPTGGSQGWLWAALVALVAVVAVGIMTMRNRGRR